MTTLRIKRYVVPKSVKLLVYTIFYVAQFGSKLFIKESIFSWELL